MFSSSLATNNTHIACRSQLDRIGWCLALLLGAVPLFAGGNAPPIGQRDARIVLRTLQYVRNLQGNETIHLGIVFDPEISASKNEADAFQKLLREEAGAQAMTTELIPINALEANKTAKVLFITRNLSTYYERIAQIALQRSLLTLSMDLECANSEGCVVAFETRAGIEIFINQKNMKRNQVDFDTAFMYTAKRL